METGSTEYELAGVGDDGPRIADGTGTVVVGGSEVDGGIGEGRTRLLDAAGETVLVLADPGIAGKRRCEIRTPDGTALGAVEGRPQASSWRSVLVDPGGDHVATVRSTTGRLETLLFNATLGFLGSLRLEVTRDGRTLAEIEAGRWQLPEHIRIASDLGDDEALITAYCLGFHVASRYANDAGAPGPT